MSNGKPPGAALPWSPWPWQNWLSAWGLPGSGNAPAGLSEPILPGWTIGNSIVVNETNSDSPQTELQIVAAQSYGRQLGRILDALAVLIAERPPGSPHNAALRDLLALHDQIDAIKAKVEKSRIERLKNDLAHLRQSDPKQFRTLLEEIDASPRVAGANSPEKPSALPGG